MSTGHGNNPEDMLKRIETMVLMGVDMPLPAIRSQIASAIDIIVYLGRLRDHSRRVLEITEVVDYKEDHYILSPLFQFKEDSFSTREKISGQLIRTHHNLYHTYKLELNGISLEEGGDAT